MSDPPANPAPSSTATASANTPQVELKATYTSPTSARTFTSPRLSLPQSTSVQQKQTYLSALRCQTAALQERINEELTRQMGVDNQREAGNGVNGKKRKVDEAAEEENYGEEVVDEDED
ncbi:Gon7 family protein [Xylariaceae sp. FL1019]|nr:Gon7 family protein [Xylariaceae sp. FL1019]